MLFLLLAFLVKGKGVVNDYGKYVFMQKTATKTYKLLSIILGKIYYLVLGN